MDEDSRLVRYRVVPRSERLQERIHESSPQPIRFISDPPFHPFQTARSSDCGQKVESMLTRFEKARILGARTLQLSLGAPPLVQSTEVDPLRIAQREMEKGVIPLTVKRS
jgi:DNA-directed RNA polymerase subunit K